MKVVVTGAAGYVGAHTAAALEAAGHDVRLFVRNHDKASRVAAAVGLQAAEIVVGDVTDTASVRRGLQGCAAVVHAAAVVSLERRHAEAAMAANGDGARAVLVEAAEHGMSSIVHVSSTSALAARPGEPLRSSSPLATTGGYAASKAAAERIARQLQDQGAPVRIIYPAGVIGPAAGESLGETSTAMARFVAAGVLPTSRAANSLVDVRDVAEIHRCLVEADDPPARVVCGGTHLPMPVLGEHLRALTGRCFPALPIPPAGLRLMGRVADAASRVLPMEIAITHESMELITSWRGTDDADLARLGVTCRPIRETLADAIASWVVAGLLRPRHAGRLARSSRSSSAPSG